MRKLRRRIPNLTALAFFEAAGRHMSFSRAADELGVTQGAVSRQIRLLESSLDAVLFRRLHRAVELTPEGERFHQAVTMALGHVQTAAEEVAGTVSSTAVTVAATHAVASFWLMPRLAQLRARFPELDLQVLVTDAELDEIGNRFDIGIRYGSGRWPGYYTVLLGRSEVFPVCSPAYLNERDTLHTPADLLHEQLLHLDDPRLEWMDWPEWFAKQGISGPYPRPALRVNSYPLLVQVAVGGQGIALGWSRFVDDLIASGTLAVPLETRIKTRQGFYLTVPENRRTDPEIEAVSEWFLAEFLAAAPDSTGKTVS